MNLDWWGQKRAVDALAARAVEGAQLEQGLRRQIVTRARNVAGRYDTIFWAGVTGFLFISRRVSRDEDDHGGLLLDFGLSALAVGRLRDLPHRIERSIERAHRALRAESRRGRTAAARAAGAPEGAT